MRGWVRNMGLPEHSPTFAGDVYSNVSISGCAIPPRVFGKTGNSIKNQTRGKGWLSG